MSVIEIRGIEAGAAPPNMWMKLTVEIASRLARKRAKLPLIFPAAYPGR